MGFNDINLQVSGPVQPASTYKTVVLKGNLPFALQVTEPNTKYVIKHNFELDGDVTIPANCVLEFDGGTIAASGNNNTITGTNTVIAETRKKIFSTDILLSGNWANNELYPEWFGATPYNVNPGTDYELTFDGFVSSIDAFNAVVRNINASNIKTIKLNAVYYVDDEITISNPNGRTKVNIVSDNPENGIAFYINDTTKYCLKVAVGSIYAVTDSVYRNFSFYPDKRSSVKGVFMCEGHLRSTHEKILCKYSCDVVEGVFVMYVEANSNIFNNRFVDLDTAGRITGAGLYYTGGTGAYLPILQDIGNCKFHGLLGCGIQTSLTLKGKMQAHIHNCELEANSKGAMFLGALDNTIIENCYWEGNMTDKVNSNVPSAPFTLGITTTTAGIPAYGGVITNTIISGLNIGSRNSSPTDYAIYLGHGVSGSYLKDVCRNVVIKGINYEKDEQTKLISLNSFANLHLELFPDAGETNELIDLIDIGSDEKYGLFILNKKRVMFYGDLFRKDYFDTSIDEKGTVVFDSSIYGITDGMLYLNKTASWFYDIAAGEELTVNGITYVAPYTGKMSQLATGDYTQGSNTVTNITKGSYFSVGNKIVGDYFADGYATITAKNGTTITVDKNSLKTKVGGILSLGFMIDKRLYTPQSTKATNELVEVGAMSFANGIPIWWNGTNWVDATGATV